MGYIAWNVCARLCMDFSAHLAAYLPGECARVFHETSGAVGLAAVLGHGGDFSGGRLGFGCLDQKGAFSDAGTKEPGAGRVVPVRRVAVAGGLNREPFIRIGFARGLVRIAGTFYFECLGDYPDARGFSSGRQMDWHSKLYRESGRSDLAGRRRAGGGKNWILCHGLRCGLVRSYLGRTGVFLVRAESGTPGLEA